MGMLSMLTVKNKHTLRVIQTLHNDKWFLIKELTNQQTYSLKKKLPSIIVDANVCRIPLRPFSAASGFWRLRSGVEITNPYPPAFSASLKWTINIYLDLLERAICWCHSPTCISFVSGWPSTTARGKLKSWSLAIRSLVQRNDGNMFREDLGFSGAVL
jgi:hypothetical protein